MGTRLSELLATGQRSGYGAAVATAGARVVLPMRVRIHGDQLEWSDTDAFGDGVPPRGSIDGACLRSFVRLADAPSERIAGFARRYGVLYLGERGLPVHPDDVPKQRDDSVPPRDHVRVGKFDIHPVWHQEPVDAWRAWSRYVGTVLLLAHELRAGERIIAPERRLRSAGFEPGDPKGWIDDDSPCLERAPDGSLELSELGWTVYQRLWPWRLIRDLDQCRTAAEQRRRLANDVSLWMLPFADYEVALGWSGPLPQPRLDRPIVDRIVDGAVNNAFTTVAGQLIAAMSTGRNLQQCTVCFIPYEVQRRRQNNRCPECAKVARSASTQRSKAKRAAKDAAGRAPVSTPFSTPKPVDHHGS